MTGFYALWRHGDFFAYGEMIRNNPMTNGKLIQLTLFMDREKIGCYAFIHRMCIQNVIIFSGEYFMLTLV